jgi:hypothetical protein
MIEIIAFIIFLISLAGIGFIVFQKIPVLVQLPEIVEIPRTGRLIDRLKSRIKNLPPFKSFSSELFLQKTLSKIRVLTLKIESKTATLLQKLRKENQEKQNNKANDNYWSEIKSSINKDEKKKS